MSAPGELWLIRHGRSPGKSDSNTNAEDFARPLSASGARQSQRAGRLLTRIAPNFDALYSSPRIRCVQSAELLGPMLGLEVQSAKLLDETLERHPRRVLSLMPESGSVAMVGHGPEWAAVIKALSGKQVWLKRGGICALSLAHGQGTITQLLKPSDIKAMLK